jgi:signal transduction histidine kinase
VTSRADHPPLAPRSWLRLPRRTARLRLSLLYGGLFLICGAALLAITYGLVHANVPATLTVPDAPTTSAAHLHAHGHPTPVALGRPHNRPAGMAASPASLVEIALRQKQLDLNGELLWSAVALSIMTLVSFGLGWYVAGRVLRPVRTIARAAQTISARNLGERLALDGPDDEFKELGDTLDQLLARLQAAFDSQRHFVANASHELRTPLTVERSLLQLAISDPHPTIESLLATCKSALVNGEQQQHLIDGLLMLARSEGGLDNPELCDLARITEQVLLAPRCDIDRLKLTIDTVLQPAPVEGNARLLERLVNNLVENAIHHNTPGGHVEITTGTSGQHACLTITNTGHVIPASELTRLFQPFERLGGTRTHHSNGHGLGLSIVQAIATAHDATITTQPRPHGGLSIQIVFARPDAPHEHAATNELQTKQTNDPQTTEASMLTARPG